MAEQIKSWNGKNILKIKSDPLREVEFSKDDPEDTDHDSPESLRKEIEPWLTALCYRKLDDNRKTLPTVLVAEEAHTFIKRYRDDAENQNAAGICTQVFEKIAREGRKFGLGLLLSSQRPSELSPTVLSQCNSFILHRISNDKDQGMVNRLVPDNLRGLLRELPSLPSQYAILLGWAAELPVLVRMNDLRKEEQPYSSDPEFWNVWTKKEERNVNWQPIVDDWQMKTHD